ncbi:MAG TPA: M12 family metallopeptidase [Verrucomicrobiae bacterium]|nr:M12 family metallopeptidase [Verrucomicrobiae bacterium]
MFIRSSPKRNGARFFLLRLVTICFAVLLPGAEAANFYAGISPANVPWPGGIVPYEFTNTLTAAETNTYLNALREWELAANVKFVPHTTETRWILFDYNTNFLDYVSGGSYNPQIVTVSSLSRAQVCHEMGHSFGFTHENIRVDKTNYVAVVTNNILNEPANIIWFTIDPTSVTNGNYDFESVMHLGWDFDSAQPGVLPTQQPRPAYSPRYQFRMGNFCLSPGDRAALAYLYGPPTVPLTNVVTTTADSGNGSLRAAMYYAQDHPGSIVKFNIPTSDSGYRNGVFTIHLTGQLPTLATDGMVIDGSTQPGFSGNPLIVLDALQIIPETFTSDTLLIYSANNQIKNISLQGFNWNGVTMLYADATNNVISGCWLGVNSTGTNAAPNAFQGILIANGANDNIIGGVIPTARNVISGNGQYGIFLTNTTGNVILGNYFGVSANGAAALPNQKSGIAIIGSTSNVIGGTVAGAGNVLSGNGEYGLDIRSPDTTGNLVQGNLIGLSANGTNAIPNTISGLLLFDGTQNNIIGGNATGARNVISGNFNSGVNIDNASNNLVAGNYIGADITGTNAIGNTIAGIYLTDGAQNNIIGGTTTSARNIISGNNSYGVYIRDSGTSGNLIEGNDIGTTSDGENPLGNEFTGIILFNSANHNLIGGSAGAGNVVSGNFSYGLYLSDPGTSDNWIQGNSIGTDASGLKAIPNYDGLIIFGGATTNFIGFKTDGSGNGNNIAFNNWDGVLVNDTNTLGITIRGNSIFGNGGLGIDLNNDGVTLNHSGFLAGPNDFQNFPIITNAFGLGNDTIVTGNLNSLANQNFQIDFYRNTTTDSSSYDQGQFYLGAVRVSTDSSGNAHFIYTNTTGNFAGQFITATATDANGDTSEFSFAVPATNQTAPAAQFTGNFLLNTAGFNFTLNLQTNFNYRIQATTNLANFTSWIDLTNFNALNPLFNFTDRSATNFSQRFYRVVSP